MDLLSLLFILTIVFLFWSYFGDQIVAWFKGQNDDDDFPDDVYFS